MATTYQSDIGAIKSLVLKHACDAFQSERHIVSQWQKLNYYRPPEFSKAVAEYDDLLALLSRFDIEFKLLPKDNETTLDSIFARDAAIVCNRGVILCNMGKAARKAEPAAYEKFCRNEDIPILGRITAPGQLEGGDVVWLDERTLAVGRGYRTNDEGISQLEELLAGDAEVVITVPLPHYKGPNDVFHLMSMLSPIDKDKLLVYSPLLPIPFREYLLSGGMQLIEVPDEEFTTLGCNVLALAPGVCLMLDCNPITQQRLQEAGVEVHTYKGDEICLQGEGGPTCLTRPLLRGV